MAEPIIALIFDFDDTLASDTTTYLLREEAKFSDKEIQAFWDDVTAMVKKETVYRKCLTNYGNSLRIMKNSRTQD